MSIISLRRMRRPVHRRPAPKNPDEVIRNFLRALERMAPRPHGGRAAAPGAVHEKP
jgi:hypothetical protein